MLQYGERNGLGNIATITYHRWQHLPIIGNPNHL